MILRHLKKLKADIALLQETHLEEQDFWRMQRQLVGQVLGSALVERKAGVMIQLHKNLQYTLVNNDVDGEGRLLKVELQLAGGQMLIYNVYSPNTAQAGFYQALENSLLQNKGPPMLVAGDFNRVCNNLEERKHVGQTKSQLNPEGSHTVTPWIEATGLVDIWRHHHPVDRKYSYYSHSQQSWSRIDYILASTDVVSRSQKNEVADIVISDLAPMWLEIAETFPRGSDNVWRMPSHLTTDEDFIDRLKGWWLEYSQDNESHR